ncbi:MAG TPA: thioredoxin-dependent thiol peroxidase [Patescibacteria group bacterium]|nr:thioredoxin-dependent thiol peroxidase [Patescibacteria group bacterium]
MKAKDFNLPDENGKYHRLSDYLGKWVVLYFYPKDDTPGCTKEACSFRDYFGELKKYGVVILGISKDSVASHKKFSDKYHLPFSLLSDETKETLKAYGAWGVKKFVGKEFEGVLRNTYLIDGNGDVRKTYEKVNPLTHAQEILYDVKEFAGIRKTPR